MSAYEIPSEQIALHFWRLYIEELKKLPKEDPEPPVERADGNAEDVRDL